MKTITTYILTAILTLVTVSSFALTPKNSRKTDIKKEVPSPIRFASLVPAAAVPEDFTIVIIIDVEVPENTFESAFDYSTLESLTPFTPEEAGFEETAEPATDPAALAPLTPEEASFEDIYDAELDLTSLAPVTPAEADFDDSDAAAADYKTLAPSVPAEATFDDAPETEPDYTLLAPVTPAEAYFED